MSDQTPDRLKAFRNQYAPSRGGAGLALGLVQLALTAAGFAALAYLALRPEPPQATAPGGLAPETQRHLAVYLAEKKDAGAAIAAYEDYLRRADVPVEERAKVRYAMAKLALDAEQYAQALSFLYEAEYLDPKSDVKDDINKKVVMCLDKLGRGVDLRQELRARTDVKKRAEDVAPDEKVLAEFAGEVLTDRDLELAVEKLPPAARDAVSTPDKKKELLKNMVAQRLLLDKARRLELDKSPEIQEQLVQALDGLIVQKLIEDEVRKSVQITPEDVERYYKAEVARFTKPATADIALAKCDSEEAAKAVAEFKEKPITIAQGRPVPGLPKDFDTAALFAAEPGTVAPPIKADDGWLAVKVVSKTPEKVMPFEDVKEQASRMLQMQKEQERLQSLLEETLQARDVKLYEERLAEQPPAQEPPAAQPEQKP